MAGPILVFDSGVGGLSVVSALRRRLPEAALGYCCDNAMLPYGTRADGWLVERIMAVCSAAVAEVEADTLVIACNTASTLALDELRARLDIPVVGTVPAIKPAAQLSRTGHLALLATSATVARPYTQRLINSYAPHCRVTRLAADALVRQAECWVRGEALDERALREALAPLAEDPEIDTVVLGCTHFPLLRDALVATAPGDYNWVDSGEAIARRTAQVARQPAPRSLPDQAMVTALDEGLTRGLSAYRFACPHLLDPTTD
ncbi:glutamate racemase [Halomonas huangheensis]|uniref:Glutamate racemase n=1 Tax=Halomonas huangheensis TaxID=1178482 RepID=W1N5I0_9GAMM|nr:glutamate racemase [Halomonas huangheensis]ALM51888.1 glutamate racemase [Halomonas huangheensis]ERL50421.1 hypothetical protein BJB45_04630 [Halomonas huangheensis]